MAEARGRCCLCKQLVLTDSDRHEIVSEVLEKHHLIYFSEGGEHSTENLVVVDPTCHRMVHRRPDEYPVERLREAKKHWLEIGRRLPTEILYDGEFPAHAKNEPLRLSCYNFALKTYGLSYRIIAPDSLSVSQFSNFLKERIVNVIASMDSNDSLLKSDRFELASDIRGSLAFEESVRLRDIEIGDEKLVLRVHAHIVAQAEHGAVVTLEARPANPNPRQDYIVTFSHASKNPIEVVISVTGTDNFTLQRSGVTSGGTFQVSVPGAQSGVEDSVSAQGDFGLLKLTLIFERSELPSLNREQDAAPNSESSPTST
jgi:hypothetical protein